MHFGLLAVSLAGGFVMKQYKIIQKDRPILKSAGLPFPENNAYIQVGVESGWTIVCGKQDLNRFFSTEKEAKDAMEEIAQAAINHFAEKSESK